MGNVLNGIVFQPPPCSYSKRSVPGILLLENHGEKVAAALIQRGPSPPKLVIFFSHGNAEDLGEVFPFLKNLCEALHAQINQESSAAEFGVAVVGYDYPGYGLSTGTPSEASVFSCARTVFQHMLQTLHITKRQVVLYGRSLGSGPTCFIARCCVKGDFDEAAIDDINSKGSSVFSLSSVTRNSPRTDADEGVAALVLQSPLLSVLRVGLRSTTNLSMPFDLFRNLERVQRGFGASVRALVIHGMKDTVVPFDHGEKLFKILGEGASSDRHSSLFIDDAGHNDVEIALARKRTTLEKEVTTFLKEIGLCS